MADVFLIAGKDAMIRFDFVDKVFDQIALFLGIPVHISLENAVLL